MILLTTATPPVTPLTENPVAIIAIGVGMLALLYVLVLRPKGKAAKRRPDPLKTPPGQRRSGLAAERSAERQMQSLVLDLEKLAREIGGQLDTKAAKLEALLARADAAAERLQATTPTVAQTKAATLVDAVAAGKSGAADSGLAALDHHRQIYDLSDAGESLDAISRKVKRPAGEVELILALRGS